MASNYHGEVTYPGAWIIFCFCQEIKACTTINSCVATAKWFFGWDSWDSFPGGGLKEKDGKSQHHQQKITVDVYSFHQLKETSGKITKINITNSSLFFLRVRIVRIVPKGRWPELWSTQLMFCFNSRASSLDVSIQKSASVVVWLVRILILSPAFHHRNLALWNNINPVCKKVHRWSWMYRYGFFLWIFPRKFAMLPIWPPSTTPRAPPWAPTATIPRYSGGDLRFPDHLRRDDPVDVVMSFHSQRTAGRNWELGVHVDLGRLGSKKRKSCWVPQNDI